MEEKRILRSSPLYWEKTKGINLFHRLKEEGKFSYLLLNLGPHCDARCRRCFMDEARRDRTEGTLSISDYHRILEEAKACGVLGLEISGEGEPFEERNKQLAMGIVDEANRLGLLTTVITNGHCLSEPIIRFLKERNATLVISLSSLDGEKYEWDNRCPGSFRLAMESIELARKAYADSIEAVNSGGSAYLVFRLAIHATAQGSNLGELKEIKEFCGKDVFFSVAPLALVGEAPKNPEIYFKEQPDFLRVHNLSDSSIIYSEESALEEFGKLVCGSWIYGLSVSWNGDVLLDAHGAYGLEGRLGNVLEDGFLASANRVRKINERLAGRMTHFCPIRDPKLNEFIKDVLEEEKISVN